MKWRNYLFNFTPVLLKSGYNYIHPIFSSFSDQFLMSGLNLNLKFSLVVIYECIEFNIEINLILIVKLKGLKNNLLSLLV